LRIPLKASAFGCALLVLKHWQGFCFGLTHAKTLMLASKQCKHKLKKDLTVLSVPATLHPI
jgi:hypothetical protein